MDFWICYIPVVRVQRNCRWLRCQIKRQNIDTFCHINILTLTYPVMFYSTSASSPQKPLFYLLFDYLLALTRSLRLSSFSMTILIWVAEWYFREYLVVICRYKSGTYYCERHCTRFVISSVIHQHYKLYTTIERNFWYYKLYKCSYHGGYASRSRSLIKMR